MTGLKRVVLTCLLVSIVAVAPDVRAAPEEVSVAYLRAAITSIDRRERVKVTAKLDTERGLQTADYLWLRNKGYSQFSIVDPQSGARFGSMYVSHDSAAFEDLVGAQGSDAFFTFTGERGRGDRKEPAIFVRDVRPGRSGAVKARGRAQVSGPQTFRVVLTDVATSNRTVLVNVELGKPYNVLGTRLLIEAEPPPDPNRIRVEAE